MNNKLRTKQRLKNFFNPLRSALIYALIGFIWLLLFDQIISTMTSDQFTVRMLQRMNELLCLIVTGVILFLILRKKIISAGESAERIDQSKHEKKTPWNLIIAFFLLTIAIITSGFIYYTDQKKTIKRNKQLELSAIADLKVQQITSWRKERISDAVLIFSNPMILDGIKNFLRNDKEQTSKNKINDWMQSLEKFDEYEHSYLIDAEGNLRLTTSSPAPFTSPYEKEEIFSIMKSNQVELTDFHQSSHSKNVHLDLFIPLIDPHSLQKNPLGLLILEINPKSFLYSLIQSWPTPSKTSETLIIRREGDDIVYLNELRHFKNTALSLRKKISNAQLPAAMAAQGLEEIMEGYDYRNVRVVAATRKIPDSPWFLISKVDIDEIYEEINERASMVTSFSGLLILTALASVILFWRHQRSIYYRKQYEIEVERRALLEHYDSLTKYANDIILLMDDQLRIVDANERAIATFGYSREDLLRKTVADIRAPETRHDIPSKIKELQEKNGLIFETLYQRKDGSILPVEVSARIIEIDGRKYYQSIIRDITERVLHREEQERNEKKIIRLNRVYTMLSNINQMIVHVPEKQQLLLEACSIAVNDGLFKMAWIGSINPQTRKIKVGASCGAVDGYLDEIQIGTGTISDENEIIGIAMHERHSIMCNDIENDHRIHEWRDAALRRGYRSTIFLPLYIENESAGIFNLYSSEPYFFDNDEIRLLEELASDISFGLESIAHEEKRIIAEKTLSESERRFREILEHVNLVAVMLDVNGFITFMNEYTLRFTGWQQDEILGKNWFEVFLPNNHEMREIFFESIHSGAIPAHYEYEIITCNGEKSIISWNNTILFDPQGNVIGMTIIGEEITEKRQSEKALEASEQHFRMLFDYAPLGYQSLDEEGILLDVNKTWTDTLGYTKDKVTSHWFGDFMTPQSAARFKADHLQLIATGELRNIEYEIIRKDKTHFIASLDARLGYSEQGMIQSHWIFNDIMEKRQIEHALRESEKKYKDLAEMLPQTLFECTLDGKLTYMNQIGFETFRYTPDDFKNGLNILQMMIPEDRERAMVNNQKMTEGENIVGNEYIALRKDGNTFPIIAYTLPIINNTRITGLRGIFIDNTERKQAENILKESEKRYRLLFETNPHPMWVYDHESLRFLAVNDAAIYHYGYRRDEFLSMTIKDICPAEDIPRLFDNISKVTDGVDEERIWRHQKKDGDIIDVEITSHTLDFSGRKTELVLAHDVTERLRAETALIASERKYRHVVENAADIIYTTSPDGNFTYANAAALKSTGYSMDELKQMNYRDLILPEYEYTLIDIFHEQLRMRQATTYMEFSFRNKTGDIKWYGQNASLITDEDTILGFLVIARDITERKQIENKLIESERKLSTLMSNLQGMVYRGLNDKNWTMQFVSEGCYELTGYTREHLLHTSISYAEIIHPADRDRIWKEVQAALELQSPFELNYRIVTSNKEEKWVWEKGRGIFTTQGELLFLEGFIADISDQKRSEIALQKAEQKYRSIFENAIEGIFQSSEDGHFITVNPALAQMFGYGSPEELMSHVTDLDLQLYVDANRRAELMRHLREHGSIARFESQVIKKNGDVILISENVRSVYDENGALLYYEGTIDDITEMKRAEELLKESEERYRSLVEVSPIGIAVYVDGILVLVNKASMKILGAADETELLGKAAIDFVHPESKKIALERIKLVLEGIEAPMIEEKFIRLDGQIIDVLVAARSFMYQGKRAVQVVISDITERKLIEKELMKLRAAVVTSGEIIFMTDIHGIITFINPEFTKIYGYTPEEIIGNHTPRILKSGLTDSSTYEFLWNSISQNQNISYEFINKTKDGKLLTIESAISPILDSNDNLNGFLAIQRDITERKQAEKDLLEAKERAERSDKLKNAFIANMSHEIRTPLNIIMGYSNVVRESFADRIAENEIEFFESIHRGGERLIKTVDEILNISRLEAGDVTLNKTLFDISVMIGNMIQDLQPAAAKKSLALNFINECGTVHIRADEYYIAQSINNLIDNAIKYTNEGRVEVQMYRSENGQVCIDVRDTGIGISEEYFTHIFEPYSQEEIGFTRTFEGIGLGLALVKKYLALHDATISVQSKKGVGSTFTIRLPKEEILEATAPLPIIKSTEADRHKIKSSDHPEILPTVLIIEDDRPTIEYMRVILKKRYEVLTADSAIDAWNILQSNSVDVILMDIGLRGEKNGLVLTQEIRQTEKFSKIPIIAVTAYAFSTDRERSIEAGCDSFLAKPIKSNELLSLMEQLIMKYTA